MKSEEEIIHGAAPQIADLQHTLVAFTEKACLSHPELMVRFEATFKKGWGKSLSPKAFKQFITSIIAEYPDVQDSDQYEALTLAWDGLIDVMDAAKRT